MIFNKRQILIISSFITIFLGSCSISKTPTIFDVEQHVVLSIHKDKMIYSNNNAEKYHVISGNQFIEYVDGIDTLKSLFLKEYYSHCYNGTEYNIFERIYILFDNELNIKEVRIQKRPLEERTTYEKFIVDFFIKSSGKWIYKNSSIENTKNTKNTKWYIYSFSIRIW
jgi:hypothetical protein